MTNHDTIDKKALSERDICTKFITPAIKDVAGWSISQFLEEFTLGKIHVRGKRDAEELTEQEQSEIIALSDQIEETNAIRMKAVAELARLRKTNVPALMEILGLASTYV